MPAAFRLFGKTVKLFEKECFHLSVAAGRVSLFIGAPPARARGVSIGHLA
jgi:hypothetical protein